ncbi:glycosyltransferase family 4 protein [Kineococcus sp. SYSU DK005]|uniref:glycosyltransferase family 4 protein n=1 Tax=Kineococcus sp. SYSU DK005 TaxID=3383126 RepID=UPI003D7CB314
MSGGGPVVHLHPGPGREMVNPYLSLLAAALRERGAEVVELGSRPFGERSVVHVHWPEMPLNAARTTWALRRLKNLGAAVLGARRHGVPVVWTVHNLRAHDGRRPALQHLLWATFPHLVDGWLSLSGSGVEPARRAFPALRRKPHRVVAHGTYAGVVGRPERRAAREALGVPAGARVVAMVGRVKPYKGVEDLVDAVRASGDPGLRLLVGGGCDDEDLRARLRAVAAGDPRLTLLLEKLPQERVDQVLAAADLLVLPFRSIFNSGSVLLCLSAGRPVLAPRTPVFEELAAEVGPGWLRLFDGPLTAAVVEEAVRAAPPRGEPDLSRHDWAAVAAAHLDFYEEVRGAATGRDVLRTTRAAARR